MISRMNIKNCHILVQPLLCTVQEVDGISRFAGFANN